MTIKVLKPWNGGQAEFKGFMGRRNSPIWKAPKIPKLPVFKENMMFNPYNFGVINKANKKVQIMLDQVRGLKFLIKVAHSLYLTGKLG